MRARAALLALLVLAGCTQTAPPDREELPDAGQDAGEREVTVLARGLDTVWEVAFAGDGRAFFTERAGTIGTIDADGGVDEWRRLPSTVEQAESGLMGLALHPAFPDPAWVYVCQTHREDGDLRNRVLRVRETDGQAGDPEPIVERIDAGSIHDGCRLAFDGEGRLLVTMGDAADASRAQDERDRNGKVLRYTPEGEPAGGNSERGWHPAVFTMGHRNPQGLALHPRTGTPYASEHGAENHDEVNALEAGSNYGWPEARGDDDGGGRYEPAVWTSGEDRAVAPAGAAFVDAPESPLHGALAVATLRAAQLVVLEFTGEADGESEVASEHVLFDGDLGRLRAATWGPDDALYVSTSNHDGRGTPGPNDDRILRVPLPLLEERTGG